MPRAQQYHAYKIAPHPNRVCNLVVAHFRVIAEHQRHPRTCRQLRQRQAHVLTAAFFEHAVQLARGRMFERHLFHALGFQVLPDAPAPQHLPTVICGHLVQPCLKRPTGVVLPDLFPQLHEDFHGRVFRVFPCRERAPAKTEYRPRKLPVEVAPSLQVSSLRPSNQAGQLRRRLLPPESWAPGLFHRSHVWIRSAGPKTCRLTTYLAPKRPPKPAGWASGQTPWLFPRTVSDRPPACERQRGAVPGTTHAPVYIADLGTGPGQDPGLVTTAKVASRLK